MKIYRIRIYLGRNEYGNEVMQRVASEAMHQHPNQRPIIVSVIEHAGWFLQWGQMAIGSPLLIVGTANDGAILRPEAQTFRETIANGEAEWLPEIRRN